MLQVDSLEVLAYFGIPIQEYQVEEVRETVAPIQNMMQAFLDVH
jgi:hypothetical protein